VRVEVIALIAAIAPQGCGHSREIAKEVRPEAGQVGCYAVSVDTRDVGNERVYPSLPGTIELLAERIPDGIRAGYKVRGPGRESVSADIVAAWKPGSDGSITVFWGREFSGTELRLQPSSEGFRGTAEAISDVPQPPKRVPAVLRRMQCAGSSG